MVRADGFRERRRSVRSVVPRLVSALALAIVAVLALTDSSSLAASGHPFLSRLTVPGVAPKPAAVAVDSHTGDLLVADDSTGTIDVYSGSGTYITQFGNGILEGITGITEVAGLAIGTDGRVYVAAKGFAGEKPRGIVYVFKPDGLGGYTLLSEWRGPGTPFGNLTGVAVSGSTGTFAGDVYIEDGSAEAVDVFKPPPAGPEEATEGTVVATIKGKPKLEVENSKQANSLAVDGATGALYVANPPKRLVEVFNAAGEFERLIKGTSTPSKAFRGIAGLAVEESTGDLYVADEEAEAVDQLNAAGESIGRISVGETKAPLVPVGVAIDNSTGSTRGKVYVTDSATQAIDTYGPTVPVPAVITGKASEVQRTLGTGAVSATLNGTIDPEGEASSYHFEYIEAGSETFQSTAPEAISGSSATEVHTTVKLKPGTLYEYRIVGESDAHMGTGSYGLVVALKVTPQAVNGVTTGAPASVTASGATLTGSLKPESIKTAYHFEYGETIGYGKPTTAAETSSKPPVAAELPVVGLTPGRTYHFRLVASNEFGTSYGEDATFTTTLAGAPTILSESAETGAPGGETVTAQINPNGEVSKYHFEYGESEAYGQSTPTPEAEVPVGGSVSAALTALKPNTTYHFRVVAINGKGETKGPDTTFTSSVASSASAPALPDGRAYELVSPPNKHGGYIEPLSAGGSLIQASEDGNSLAYVDLGSVVENPEGNLSPEPEQVLATRGASSWSSQEIVTPSERPREANAKTTAEYLAFSPNLSLALLQPLPFSYSSFAEPPLTPPLSEAERGHQEKTIYLRANPPLSPDASQAAIYEEARQNGEKLAAEHGESAPRPGFLALVTAFNTPGGTAFGGVPERRGRIQKPRIKALDATPDLSHVVLQSDVSLTAPPSAPGLYEWAAGKLQLVSVLPSGQPASVLQAKVELGADSAEFAANSYHHAISDDGSRVIWSQARQGERETVEGSARLFLRDMTRGETIQLDKPAPGITPTPGRVVYQDASADGSKVFFTDTQPLTADAKASIAGSPPVEKPDLYECEIVEEAGKLACKLSDLTAPPTTGENAALRGVLGASEDGSYVYIVATGVLSSGGQPGQNNLYALHEEGGTWSTKFIATLSSEDLPDWAPSPALPLVAESQRQTVRVSPNGHYLAFMSNRRLTGYNNTDVNEEGGQHADEEVFLYNAVTAAIACASCNPSGARPRGVLDQTEAGEGIGLVVDRVGTWLSARAVPTDHWLAGSVPGATPLTIATALRQPRYLSDSGRLFFTSADALVPEAAGKTRPETIVPGGKPAAVGVENVYQYEPTGAGNCANEAGCVGLISSGTSQKESALLDASTSGNDVFFVTDSKLLPQDIDSSYDVYDARVCSSESPCQVPPSPSAAPCASSEQCRSSGSSAQTFQPPLTSTFSGPGNVTHVLPTGSVLPAKASTPPLTKAQKLARALKVCRRLPHKTHSQKLKRARCETHARKLYGPKRKKK